MNGPFPCDFFLHLIALYVAQKGKDSCHCPLRKTPKGMTQAPMTCGEAKAPVRMLAPFRPMRKAAQMEKKNVHNFPVRVLSSSSVGNNSWYSRVRWEPKTVLSHVLLEHMEQTNAHRNMHIFFQQEINKTFTFSSE